MRVIIFEDLQCGDCATLRQMMDDKILPKFGQAVAFEHRDFPFPKHTWARPAAIAARYFHAVRPELGLIWRRFALDNRAELTPESFKDRLAEFAKRHGADSREAIAALEDARLQAAVEADYQDGIARGVVRTPTVFVNGRSFIETFTFAELSAGIEAAVAGQ